MSLLKFFKPASDNLPTLEQTEFPEQAVSSANHAVKSVLERERQMADANRNT